MNQTGPFRSSTSGFGIIYTPAEQTSPEFNSYTYSSVPKCYTYMDLGGLSASGINRPPMNIPICSSERKRNAGSGDRFRDRLSPSGVSKRESEQKSSASGIRAFRETDRTKCLSGAFFRERRSARLWKAKIL